MTSEAQFVAGFIDGDGCIALDKHCSGHSNNVPTIVVGQSCDTGPPPELLYVQTRYGGTLSSRRPKSHYRLQWRLAVCKEDEVKRLLEDLVDFAIVKRSQAQLALEYLLNGKERHNHYCQEISSAKGSYASVAIPSERLSDAYLAGLFAAEGCVVAQRNRGNYEFHTSITQSSCRALLHAVKQHLGFGAVISQGQWKLSSHQTMIFFERIVPHLVGQKLSQVNIVLEFQRARPKNNRKRTAEQIEKAEIVLKKLREMKKM